MERRRLKTVMILILALTNAFLLFDLGRFRLEESAARRRAEERLVDLFAADGMLLPPEAVSHEKPPDAVLLPRDEAGEAAAARFFLAEGLSVVQARGGWSYFDGSASAWFLEDGSFTVTGLEIADNAVSLCREFCRANGLREPPFPAAPDGLYAAGAVYRGLEVYNSAVTFLFRDGALREVSGTLLPSGGLSIPAERPLLSASGALTAFQSARREDGGAVVEITSVSLCYALRGGGEALTLAPAWRIETGEEVRYVDCATGAVTSG